MKETKSVDAYWICTYSFLGYADRRDVGLEVS